MQFKLFDTLIVFLNEFFENVNFQKKSADDNKSMKNYPVCKELKIFYLIYSWHFCSVYPVLPTPCEELKKIRMSIYCSVITASFYQKDL